MRNRRRTAPRQCAAALLALLGVAVAAAADEAPLPRIAIVIDDMGNRLADDLAAVDLPGPVTYSILPHTPYARRLARVARHLDKEVLLHLPMESDDGLPLGPGGLTADMSVSSTVESLRSSLDSVPHLTGVSSHMGSRLTRDPYVMRVIMDGLRAHGGLLFLDSRTTPDSVAGRIAVEHGVPSLTRDVFLDHDRDPESILAQFRRLLAVAHERGAAIGVGHPYPETMQVLNAVLPGLEAFGVRLSPLSRLLDTDADETATPLLRLTQGGGNLPDAPPARHLFYSSPPIQAAATR